MSFMAFEIFALRGDRPHAEGYRKLLHALIEDRLDEAAAEQAETLHHDTLPLIEKA